MAPAQRQADGDDLFRIVWEALSEYGLCDGWGGAEQQRVYDEWVAAGRPVGRAEWIIARANADAQGNDAVRASG